MSTRPPASVRFSKLDKKPDAWDMAVPYQERPTRGLALPKLSLLSGEVTYWRDELERAQRVGDEYVKGLAPGIRDELDKVSRKGTKLQVRINNSRRFNSTELINWYKHGTTFFAWSRMWREATAPADRTSPTGVGWSAGPGEMPLAIADLDINPNNLRFVAIHSHNSFFGGLFGVKPPDHEAWLEGETVFLHALPFEPSPLLAQKLDSLKASGDLPKKFPAKEFLTVRSFVKSTVWQTYPPRP